MKIKESRRVCAIYWTKERLWVVNGIEIKWDNSEEDDQGFGLRAINLWGIRRPDDVTDSLRCNAMTWPACSQYNTNTNPLTIQYKYKSSQNQYKVLYPESIIPSVLEISLRLNPREISRSSGMYNPINPSSWQPTYLKHLNSRHCTLYGHSHH